MRNYAHQPKKFQECWEKFCNPPYQIWVNCRVPCPRREACACRDPKSQQIWFGLNVLESWPNALCAPPEAVMFHELTHHYCNTDDYANVWYKNPYSLTGIVYGCTYHPSDSCW